MERRTTTHDWSGDTDVWVQRADWPCVIAEVSAQIGLLWQQRSVVVTHQVIMREDQGDFSFKKDRMIWLNNNNVVLMPIAGSMRRKGGSDPLVSILVEQLDQVVE